MNFISYLLLKKTTTKKNKSYIYFSQISNLKSQISNLKSQITIHYSLKNCIFAAKLCL